ncbi:MAG: twitching motility protein PilT, partial [Proteobacteria bacterium]|nr:twitching motility protein PilT [Pseudomonadota bacterium]
MTATFRLYEELNDALPQGRRKAPFPVRVRPGDTVQTCLRRLGVA